MLRRARCRRTCAAIDAHIIHQHGLRKTGGCVRASRPRAPYRDVEQHKKRMIVNPLRSLGQIGGSTSRVKMVIDVKADRVRFPLHCEKMKVVRKSLIAGKPKGSADAVR